MIKHNINLVNMKKILFIKFYLTKTFIKNKNHYKLRKVKDIIN